MLYQPLLPTIPNSVDFTVTLFFGSCHCNDVFGLKLHVINFFSTSVFYDFLLRAVKLVLFLLRLELFFCLCLCYWICHHGEDIYLIMMLWCQTAVGQAASTLWCYISKFVEEYKNFGMFSALLDELLVQFLLFSMFDLSWRVTNSDSIFHQVHHSTN